MQNGRNEDKDEWTSCACAPEERIETKEDLFYIRKYMEPLESKQRRYGYRGPLKIYLEDNIFRVYRYLRISYPADLDRKYCKDMIEFYENKTIS